MERLRSHRDFTTVLRRRRKVSSRDLVVHYLIRDAARPVDTRSEGDGKRQVVRSSDTCRLGLAVSKAVGKAVTRNHVKRRFRQLARSHEGLLPDGCDLVIRAKPGAAKATYQSLDAQIGTLFHDISRKVNPDATLVGDSS